MGNRFLNGRYPLEECSDRRAFLRLNEGDFEPHRMRPYGLESGNFTYRQMFRRQNGSRPGNRSEERSYKKSVRQQSRRELRDLMNGKE